MVKALALLVLLLSSTSRAFDVREVSLNYRRFDSSNRIPDLAGFVAKEGIDLTLNTDLGGPFYWNNKVVSLTDNGGYKLVGWNIHLGVKLGSRFRFEYEHFSKHLLDHGDSVYPAGKFPVQDSLGFVWILYGSP